MHNNAAEKFTGVTKKTTAMVLTATGSVHNTVSASTNGPYLDATSFMWHCLSEKVSLATLTSQAYITLTTQRHYTDGPYLDATSFVWHCLRNDVSLAALTSLHLQKAVGRVADAARQNSAA